METVNESRIQKLPQIVGTRRRTVRMIQAHMIVMKNHKSSEFTASNCIETWKSHSSIPVEIFDAITPPTVLREYKTMGIEWNPVGHSSTVDLPKTALNSTSRHNLSKASCAMSHIKLWDKSAKSDTDIVILEHDAALIKELTQDDIEMIQKSPYGIVSLGEPMPRKRIDFLFEGDNIDSNFPKLEHTKCLSDGGTAYYVKSWAAKKLMEKIYSIGYMPCNNDTFISTWFGFDFLASPSSERWVSPKIYPLSTSSNWQIGM